jgi:hypothetical protein
VPYTFPLFCNKAGHDTSHTSKAIPLSPLPGWCVTGTEKQLELCDFLKAIPCTSCYQNTRLSILKYREELTISFCPPQGYPGN